MRIGKVELYGGPNIPFILVTIALFVIDWRWGVIWLAFWILLTIAIIIFLNTRD